MRIEVRRTGGFAGIARTFAVDTATLPPARAAEIERLARAIALGTPTPDAFSYDVTIDGKTLRGVDAEALVSAMTQRS
jgi:hypothetical protein